MASRNVLKCVTCSLFRPGRSWDMHQQCPRCRSCSRKTPCEVCIDFSADNWQEIDSWVGVQRGKLQKRLDLLPTPDPVPGPVPEVREQVGEEREEREESERPPTAEPMCSARASGDPLVPAQSGLDTTRGRKRKPPTAEPMCSARASGDPLVPAQSGIDTTRGKKKKPKPSSKGKALLKKTGPEGHGGSSVPGTGTEAEGSEPERFPGPRPEGSRNRTQSRSRSPSRSKSRSRSRSPRRGRARKRRTSSSGSESDRERRRRRRSPRRSREEDREPPWLAKLTGLLQPLLESASKSVAPAPAPAPAVATGPEPSAARSQQDVDPGDFLEEEDILDCQASLAMSGLDYQDDLEEILDEDAVDASMVQEEGGPSISPDLMSAATQIFREHLGFEAQVEEEVPRSRGSSKLTTTGEQEGRRIPVIPVDSSCFERFDALAGSSKWSACPTRQDRVIRVADQDWQELFRAPLIPQEARERLRVEQGTTSGTFKDPSQRKMDDVLTELDTAARVGMKYGSIFMLLGELLMRAHQQLPGDERQISRKEIGQLLLLFGPLARLNYDQFARVAIKTVATRRESLVSAIRWPSVEAKARMLSLPFRGPDLFAGQFQTRLQEEVTRRETLVKSNFRLPNQNRGRGRARGSGQPRGNRGGRGGFARANYRGRARGRGARGRGWQGASGAMRGARTDGNRPSTSSTFGARP